MDNIGNMEELIYIYGRYDERVLDVSFTLALMKDKQYCLIEHQHVVYMPDRAADFTTMYTLWIADTVDDLYEMYIMSSNNLSEINDTNNKFINYKESKINYFWAEDGNKEEVKIDLPSIFNKQFKLLMFDL